MPKIESKDNVIFGAGGKGVGLFDHRFTNL